MDDASCKKSRINNIQPFADMASQLLDGGLSGKFPPVGDEIILSSNNLKIRVRVLYRMYNTRRQPTYLDPMKNVPRGFLIELKRKLFIRYIDKENLIINVF